MKKAVKKFFDLAKSEQAVLFSVMSTGWAFLAGPVTVAIVGARFTPELQGYYQTFLTVIGLSAYLQLGLGRVIIQFASHEWAKLSLDENGCVTGDETAKSRLANLAKFSVKWYFIVGIISIVLLGIGGAIFFVKSKDALETSIWLAPWISLAVLCGLQMMFTPFFYLLEGCNQVKTVYKFRFFTGMAGNISIWIAVYSGAELWTYSVFFAVWMSIAAIFIRIKYWNFLKSIFISKAAKEKLDWFKELMPLQIKLVILSFSTYIIFQFYTLGAMFARGPFRACQTGTTILFILMLGTIMGAFLNPKMPYFGILIAEKKYIELDKLFLRLFTTAASIMIFGGIVLWFGVLMLNVLPFRLAGYYAERLLGPTPTAVFIIAFILWMFSYSSGWYLLAHKKMPQIWLVIITTILSVVTMLLLGNRYGITETGVGLIGVQLIMLPAMLITILHYRKKWHKT